MAQTTQKIPAGYKQTEVGVIPDDWDVDSISHLASITTGKKNTQDKIEEGDFPFFVRSKTVERINSYSFDGESILTAGDGVGTGKVFHYIKGKFDFHQRVYKISGFKERVDGYFFYLYFSNHFLSRIMQMTAKSSVDSVRMEMIADMKIPLPSTKDEQKSIATVLSDIDELIIKLEELVAKKRAIKQGAMQELLTGKRRLPGFSGEWEIENFPNVCWFQEGPGIRTAQFSSSGVKLLNGTNINNGKLSLETTERFISEREAYGMYSHFLADEGDIIIACSGITIEKFHGKVTVLQKKHLPLCMNTSTMRFKLISKKLTKSFLRYFLQSEAFKKQIGGQATGSAQLNFGPFHVKKIEIYLPKPSEQAAISQVLSDMDFEIEELEQKLNKHRMLKVGVMQELLTGKTRLL